MTHSGRIRSLLRTPVVSAVLAAAATFAMVLQMTGTASAVPQEGGASQASEGRATEAQQACRHANFDPEEFTCLGAFWAHDSQGNRVEIGPRLPDFFFDDGLRKLVVAGGSSARQVRLFDVDTATGTPQQTALVSWPLVEPNNNASLSFDPVSHRLFASLPPEAAERECSLSISAPGDLAICAAAPHRVGALDLTTLGDPDGNGTVGVEVALPAQYGGKLPWGMAYSAPHEVLYVISRDWSNNAQSDVDRSNAFAQGVVLHAFDMSKVMPGPEQDPADFEAEPDAAHLWDRRLDGCPKVMGDGHVDVVDGGGALYLPCIQGSFPSPPPAARHAVTVVDLNLDGRHPRNLSDSDVQEFGIENYSFAGSPNHWDTSTAIDRVQDRLAISVSGDRPRIWVFDAANRGFIGSNHAYVTKDSGTSFVPGTGRMYADADRQDITDKKQVYDTRQLPIPQGRTVEFSPNVVTGDASSNRIYTHAPVADRRSRASDGEGVEAVGAVFADLTGAFPGDPKLDPDADTHDIDPEAAVSVSHTGAGSGYGARLRWVGGFKHATERPKTWDQLESYCAVTRQVLGPCREEGETLAERADLSADDRDSFFGTVGQNIARSTLSGDRVSGAAQANATGVSLGEPWWEDYATHVDEDRQRQGEGEFQTSTCGDRGAGDESATNEDAAPGSQVTCEPKQQVTASAWSSDLQNGMPGIDVKVGYARSDLTTERDPGKGVTSTVTSVARNVSVGLPQAGALHIGEIRTVAKTWAGGRPGTAGSEFDVSINQVRLEGPDGETQFACGWDTAGVSTGTPDDPDGRCDPTALTAALSRVRPSPVTLVLPRRDTREEITGSPGGAQAVIQKAPNAFWNDKLTMGDERWELPGLRLVLYKDGERDSRFVLDLAGARAEAKYLIGQSATAPPPPSDDGPIDLQPAGLKIELNDPDGEPLSGGEFAVHRDVLDDGLLDTGDPLVDTNAGTCTTGEDGVGDCVFDELDPGGYVITQTAAPDGYAPAPDFPVTLTDGFTSTVAFTNQRSVADIKITLTDTADPPNLLPGAVFVAVHGDAAGGADADGGLAPPDLSDLRDEGALQQHTFRCTTDEDGRCAMADVPLGHYTVRQTSAPDGYQPLGEDITFEFTEPGQVADLGLTNVTAADDGGTQLAGEGSATFDGGATTGTGQAGLSSGPSSTAPVRLDAGQAAPEPVVASQPNEQEQGLRRLVKLPAQGLGFLLRSPGEAAPFAAVWLLLGAPIYLLARRRSLNMTTTGQIS